MQKQKYLFSLEHYLKKEELKNDLLLFWDNIGNKVQTANYQIDGMQLSFLFYQTQRHIFIQLRNLQEGFVQSEKEVAEI